MTAQASTGALNAILDALATYIGPGAVLKVFTGSKPASAAASDSGTLLASIQLPTEYMAPASGGSKAKAGTWSDSAANATGTAGHFRLYASNGTTCHIQGEVTATGGGGTMTVDSTSFTSGQSFTVTGFTWTMSVANG